MFLSKKGGTLKRKIALLLCCSIPLFSSLSLYNDSPFFLNVRVAGANGVCIIERKIGPQERYFVEDQIGLSNPTGEGEQPSTFRNYDNSLTPYQVFWYCQGGDLYSSCTDAASGATVTANTCEGLHGCSIKP